jgi:hypothetical protein
MLDYMVISMSYVCMMVLHQHHCLKTW